MKKASLFATALVSMFAFNFGTKAMEVSSLEELRGCLSKDGSCTLTENIVITTNDILSGKAFNAKGNPINSMLNVDGTKVVLDLNGYSISTTGFVNIGIINIDNSGELTINDSKGKGVITTGDSDTYAAVTIWRKSKLTVNGGTIEGKYYGISGNGSTGVGDTTITINNGTIKGIEKDDNYGIYHPQLGTLTINGGEITGATGIELRSGNLLVNGGKISGISVPTTTTPNGNGTTTVGSGIAIVQHTTKNEINVTIKNGLIEGYTAFYQNNTQKNDEEAIAKITLSLLGGTFNTINGGKNAIYSENKTNFVTGGTFNADILPYVAEKHIVKQDGKTYTVVANKVLEATEGTFESEEPLDTDLVLSIVAAPSEKTKEATEKVNETYKSNEKIKDLKLISLYYISLLKSQEVVPVEDGKFTISLAIDESLRNFKNYKVIYLNEDGNIEEVIDAKLVDGKVVFTTTHLSTYGVIAYNDVVNQGGSTIKNPQTGDKTIYYITTGIISAVVLTSAIVLKKRKIEG